VSYVINNDLDPVPQVPLSLQVPSEVISGIANENKGKGSLIERLVFDDIQAVTSFNQKIKNIVAQRSTEIIARRFDEKKMNLDLHYFDGEKSPAAMPATSLNYILAGQLIPLFGQENGGDLYPRVNNDPDVLLHHHATSYRKLIQHQIP